MAAESSSTDGSLDRAIRMFFASASLVATVAYSSELSGETVGVSIGVFGTGGNNSSEGGTWSTGAVTGSGTAAGSDVVIGSDGVGLTGTGGSAGTSRGKTPTGAVSAGAGVAQVWSDALSSWTVVVIVFVVAYESSC